MDMCTIGAILKNRIKEMGFTQEEFSEETGIGLSTLRKYMNGTTAYNYQVLEILSEKLDCSYNYLLGKSKSPREEFHNAVELTRLSEEAMEKISKYASVYDTEFEGRRFIKCLDMIIRKDGLFHFICDFLISSKMVNSLYAMFSQSINQALQNIPKVKELGIEEDMKLNLESMHMIYIVSALKDLKAEMTPEFIAELNELDFAMNIQELQDKWNELGQTKS